jgi:hypothetical protein
MKGTAILLCMYVVLLPLPAIAEKESLESGISPDWSWKLTSDGPFFAYRIEEDRQSYNAFYSKLNEHAEEVWYGYRGTVGNAMRDLETVSGVDFVEEFLDDRTNTDQDANMSALYFSDTPQSVSVEWEGVSESVVGAELNGNRLGQRQANFILNVWCWFTSPGTTPPGAAWSGIANGTTTTTVSCGTCGVACFGIVCCTNVYVWNATCNASAGCWMYNGQTCGSCH